MAGVSKKERASDGGGGAGGFFLRMRPRSQFTVVLLFNFLFMIELMIKLGVL